MTTPRDPAELCTVLGRQVLAQTTTDGALGAVTEVAVAAIPDVSYASITRARSSGLQTSGATHPDAERNDRTQYALHSGPCVDAVDEHGAGLFHVPDLATDARYPDFGPAAVATGVASMLSVRMVFDDDQFRASLNLYSRTPDAFDDTALATARLIAAHGALAVAAVVARHHIVSLERALANSRTIGTAIGILMTSTLITADDAFALLRVASQTGNRKLSDIAAEVVATGTLDRHEPR